MLYSSDSNISSDAGPFSGAGVFTTHDPLSALPLAGKVEWVAVMPDADPAAVQKLKEAGLRIVVWDPNSSDAGLEAVQEFNASGYIAQAEGPYQLEAALAQESRIAVPKALVGNPQVAGSEPGSWPDGWIAMPEAYENANPNATIQRVVAAAKQAGAEIVIPVTGSYDAVSEGGGKIQMAEYNEDIRELGLKNYAIYSSEYLNSEDIAAIGQDMALHTPASPPVVNPPVANHPARSDQKRLPYEHGQGHPAKNAKPKHDNIFDKVSPPDIQDRRSGVLLGLHKGDGFQGYGDVEDVKKLKNGGKVYTLESGAKMQVNPDGSYYRVAAPPKPDESAHEARLASLEAQGLMIDSSGVGKPTSVQSSGEQKPTHNEPQPPLAETPTDHNVQPTPAPQLEPAASPLAWHTNQGWHEAGGDVNSSIILAKAQASGAEVLESREGKNGNTIYRLSDGSYQTLHPDGSVSGAGTWDNTAWNQSQYAQQTNQFIPPPMAGPAGGSYDPSSFTTGEPNASQQPSVAPPTNPPAVTPNNPWGDWFQ